MWDWRFGWHSCESARYKLWHPGAHLFSAIGEDRSALPGLTDRQRYVGNVSYVDEYVGASLQRLAIRFVEAAELGFEDRPDTTHVCARVGISDVPLAGGWPIHQVRPTADGAEMRSRFFLDHPQILPIPPVASSRPAMARVLSSPMVPAIASVAFRSMSRRAKSDRTGHDLLHHCATEMNHLAGFLPELYREFAGAREDRAGPRR